MLVGEAIQVDDAIDRFKLLLNILEFVHAAYLKFENNHAPPFGCGLGLNTNDVSAHIGKLSSNAGKHPWLIVGDYLNADNEIASSSLHIPTTVNASSWIRFGSVAHGTFHENSDIDLLNREITK